jgi:hypothetical protein
MKAAGIVAFATPQLRDASPIDALPGRGGAGEPEARRRQTAGVGSSLQAELTPRYRIEAACVRLGRGTVVAGCVELLAGGEIDHDLVITLGGPHARDLLSRQRLENQAYWLRVWAARGLLWAWDDTA